MSKIIVALDGLLDGHDWHKATELMRKLRGKVWGFKFNDALHSGHYWTAQVRPYGNIMFDAKLYDIPTTMRNTVKQFVNKGADFITVHASAGKASLEAAVEAAGKNAKIMAVTVLTSFAESDCLEVFGGSRSGAVWKLTDLAGRAGVHGVVCASEDLPMLATAGKPLLKICPGIRPDGAVAGDDQKSVGSGVGADYVVVGRPITQAEDPIAVVDRLNELI